MSKQFVTLTGMWSQMPVYVRTKLVSWVELNNGHDNAKGTVITMMGEDQLVVAESPEEVVRIVSEASNDR